MTFDLSRLAALKSQENIIEPVLVLEIEGVPTRYGNITISKTIKYGDTSLTYGSGAVYGGVLDLEDQANLISFSSGTSTTINQQLRPDLGFVSSVSSMTVSLVDKDEEITDLISPGITVTDILARKAVLSLGFKDTGFPDDYITIFRGIIDDTEAGPGLIKMNITHPDNKKRASIYEKYTDELTSSITSGVTTIPVTDTDEYLVGITGPDLTIDPAFTPHIRIEDEIMEVSSKVAASFTVIRGALGTTAVAHDDESAVESVYSLEEGAMELALKLMMSGKGGPYREDVEVESFVDIGGGDNFANSIFFSGIDVEDKYGIIVGDFITTTGASTGANNVTLKPIVDIVQTELGSYIVISGVTFIAESPTSALIDFRSQFDTLPDGLLMDPEEVDVPEHIRVRDLFLASFSFRFNLKDTINEGKDFLNKEIYAPSGSYALPRKAKSSVGFHSAPIPGANIKTVGRDSIKKPDKLILRRTINRNFFNTIVFAIDEDVIDDRFKAGVVTTDATSKTRIPIGNKVKRINAKGMRTDLTGVANAVRISNKLLDRYKFGTEFFEKVEMLFRDSFNLEVGDIVIFNFEDMKVINTVDGNREKETKMFEVTNKKMNFKTGDISLELIDTGFDGSQRYALITPASFVGTGLSTTQFEVDSSFNSKFFFEGDKWARFIGDELRIRTDNGSSNDTGVLQSVSGNILTVSTPLSFTPSAGMIVEHSGYDNQADETHLKYGFMTDTTFSDGSAQYLML